MPAPGSLLARWETPQTDPLMADRWHEAILLMQPHLRGRHDVTVLPFLWSRQVSPNY